MDISLAGFKNSCRPAKPIIALFVPFLLLSCGKSGSKLPSEASTKSSENSKRRLTADEFVSLADSSFPEFARVRSADRNDYLAVLQSVDPTQFGPLLQQFMARVEDQFQRPGQGVTLGLFNYWVANTEIPTETRTRTALEVLLKIVCAHAENPEASTCESGAPPYELIVERMRVAAETHGLAMEEIGRSEVFDLPIYALATPRREGHPLLWMEANIHGDEHMGIEVIFDTIERRTEEGSDLAGADFVFIPIVNPDGYRISTTQIGWRKNAFLKNGFITGIDLNRNFPTRTFKPTSPLEPFFKEFSPGPALAKEIRVLVDYARKVKPVGALDFHSNHNFIAYDDLAEQESDASATRTISVAKKMAAAFLNERLESNTYIADSAARILKVDRVHGTFGEWFRQELGAVAFSVELLDPAHLTTWPAPQIRASAVEGARPAVDAFVSEFL